MEEKFFSFNRYLRERFGQRVHRLSLDAGFSCPNIDGTLSNQGCIFCNNKAFSHFTRDRQPSLEEQIIQSREYARKRFKAKKFIAYFQAFSSTYGDIDFLRQQYDTIRRFNDIVGLAISTRPDCIDKAKLDLIEDFTKDYEVYIEYGLQTVHQDSLKFINRNQTFSDFQRAVELTSKRKNINIAAHIILGLPYESKADMLATAGMISKLPLWGVKFHCLHVVKDTRLEEIYNEGEVKLLSCDEYIDILVSFLEVIPAEWVILRLVSDADKELLIAPKWINDKQAVLKRIEEEFSRRKTYQGALLHQGLLQKG